MNNINNGNKLPHLLHYNNISEFFHTVVTKFFIRILYENRCCTKILHDTNGTNECEQRLLKSEVLFTIMKSVDTLFTFDFVGYIYTRIYYNCM